ncbi:MAG: aminoacyl-tRNA hydrolase [Ignavibacteriae bacterium]|nr:aminoacyl-tRNA hydrolase [Ignavibacteriota bacterium]
MDPIIVVGLGNPGSEYVATRHNLGFMVVDEVCRRLKKKPNAGRGNYLSTSASVRDKRLVLVKPLTYMNNSGLAVEEVMSENNASVNDLLVISDDLALPLGTIRVRARGSDGGHNGLASIIYYLNSAEFARIRCGIRREVMPPKHEMADFVLSPFEAEEKETATEMIQRAGDAVIEFVVSGIAATMNKFNN